MAATILQSRGLAEFSGHIRPFPSELGQVTAEMPAETGPGVDGPCEVEILNHPLRGQGEEFAYNLAYPLLADSGCTFRIDKD